MSATRVRKEPESVAQVPQSTPSMLGMGMPGHDFTLQAVMELQKSVGEMNANLQALKGSVDSIKTKVDDLVGWKHKILGGAAVLAVVVAALSFLMGKASEYVTWKSPAQQVAAPAVLPAPAGQPIKP
jgi:hypothetical protein